MSEHTVTSDQRKQQAWSARNPGNRAIRRELLHKLRRHAGPILDGAAPILDIGCGGGWLLQELARELAPNRLAGIDVREDRIAAARRRLPAADLRVGDARKLPWPDGRFGLVVIASLLSSLSGDDANLVLDEARRVLSGDGILVVYDVRVRNPRNRGLRRVGKHELENALGHGVKQRSLTLAPPLARRLGPLTPVLYPLLSFPPLSRSHGLWVMRNVEFRDPAIEAVETPDEGWDATVAEGRAAELLDADRPYNPPEQELFEAVETPDTRAREIELDGGPARRAGQRDTHVWMFVRNPCTNDRRVLREARTLGDAGYRVTILAIHRPGLPTSERHGPVEIVRLAILPPHYRILRWYRTLPTMKKLVARVRRRWRLIRVPLTRRLRRRGRIIRAQLTRRQWLAARRLRIIRARFARGRYLARRRAVLTTAAMRRWFRVRRSASVRARITRRNETPRHPHVLLLDPLIAVAWWLGGAVGRLGSELGRATWYCVLPLGWLARGAGKAPPAIGKGSVAAVLGFGAGLRLLLGGLAACFGATYRGFRAWAALRLRLWQAARELAAAGRSKARPVAAALATPRRALTWLNHAPQRAAIRWARRRMGRIVGDMELAATGRSRVPLPPAAAERANAVAWVALSLPLGVTIVAALLLDLTATLWRLLVRALARAVALVWIPMPTLRAMLAGIRPTIYAGLQVTLMRLHKPLLLYDYTRRATDHVTRRLDPTEAWNPARHQIFHAHDLNTLLAAFRLARATSSPLIYDSHELQLATSRATESAPLIRFGLRHYERFLIRRARASITVCDSLARIIAAVHSVRAPTVVRNTPDYVPVQSTRTHVLRDALGIADDLKIALYHGNVTAYRGLEVMLEALPLMPGVAVVFLGTGALRRELEAEAERLDVLGRTAFFHDPVPGDVLNEYIRSANVGVIPLEVHVLNYYFSLPNKLFELTMAGCPIVATDLPEIRAFVSRHGLGRLFAPGSADELAAAVHATLALPAEELEAYRARADEAARQNCWEIERDKLLGVYSALEPGAAATGAAPLRVAA